VCDALFREVRTTSLVIPIRVLGLFIRAFQKERVPKSICVGVGRGVISDVFVCFILILYNQINICQYINKFCLTKISPYNTKIVFFYVFFFSFFIVFFTLFLGKASSKYLLVKESHILLDGMARIVWSSYSE